MMKKCIFSFFCLFFNFFSLKIGPTFFSSKSANFSRKKGFMMTKIRFWGLPVFTCGDERAELPSRRVLSQKQRARPHQYTHTSNTHTTQPNTSTHHLCVFKNVLMESINYIVLIKSLFHAYSHHKGERYSQCYRKEPKQFVGYSLFLKKVFFRIRFSWF